MGNGTRTCQYVKKIASSADGLTMRPMRGWLRCTEGRGFRFGELPAMLAA
jgi:hypothetical protein